MVSIKNLEEKLTEIYRLNEEAEKNNFLRLLEDLFPDYIKNHSNEDLENLISSLEDDLITYEEISMQRFDVIFKTIQNYNQDEKDIFLLYVLLCNRYAQIALDDMFG